jgi:SAM-dependent methyltransferase
MHFASHYRWLVYQHLFAIPTAPPTLLDIGSDDGGFVERIHAPISVAVDLSRRSLRKVRSGIAICADGTRLPLGDTTFDHVVLSDVIEHVPDDRSLVMAAAECVRPGGALWLSTTADGFTLFPAWVTERAERSWRHVRKGYSGNMLLQMVGNEFDSTLIAWPEVVFRHFYLVIWLCSKFSPPLARLLATLCFLLDKHFRTTQLRKGHLYLRAIRRARPAGP